MIRNQLNQKFKLLVKILRCVMYFDMPPHTKVFWAINVDVARALL